MMERDPALFSTQEMWLLLMPIAVAPWQLAPL